MGRSGLIVLTGLLAATGSAFGQGSGSRVEVADCNVKYLEQALVASERSGVVAVVDVREGDAIRAKQRLIQLKDELQRAQLATLVRQADSPESDAKVVDAQLTRDFTVERYNIAVAAKRQNTDAVSRAELLELKTTADRSATRILEAQLELEVTRLKKKEAEAELRMCTIPAPFDGFVTRVLKQPGEAVQLGDPVAEVVNPQRLKVEGYVAADEALRLKPGMKVTATPQTASGPQPTGEGILVFVDVGVEPVSQRVRVWAEIDNRDRRLQPGLLARLSIDLTPPAEVEPTR
jgi:RND family efflux transporter MFP subunit